MKEQGQDFSLESIDQQTEHFVDQLSEVDSRLVTDLYQTYALYAEEYSHSLQRIWSRLAQARSAPLQDSERLSTHSINTLTGRPDDLVPGSFQPPPQRPRRTLWSRFSSVFAVAAVLLIVLSWVLLTNAFFKGNHPGTPGTTLALAGGPDLSQDIVFLVKSSDSSQYLASISFETYDGRTWHNNDVSSTQLSANQRTTSEGLPVHVVTQSITVVNPSGDLQPYIIGAGQIASVNQPAALLTDNKTGRQLAVIGNNDQSLAAGEQYTVQSYVSSADVAMLQGVPLPADAPADYYKPAILSTYLQLPKNLDPRIMALAARVTSGAKTMYDMAVDLENYLRSHYTYNTNINPPSGAEGVSWFLFNSGNQAFCNYFASAMAIMARQLGMPARVIVGYTNGTMDTRTGVWTIRGSDAHAWTQIFFAGYGWINFEPSPGFPAFARPLAPTSLAIPA